MFLVTGLASVGFPGTFGFVGTEILIDGAIQRYPHVGVAVVVALALNGIAIVKVYMRIFTGRRVTPGVSLAGHWSERWGLVALGLLIIGGGIYPQPGIASRYHAASEVFREMKSKIGTIPEGTEDQHHSDEHGDSKKEGITDGTDEDLWPEVETFKDSE
jgi:NADH-quinone oxidoreductase subunit M